MDNNNNLIVEANKQLIIYLRMRYASIIDINREILRCTKKRWNMFMLLGLGESSPSVK